MRILLVNEYFPPFAPGGAEWSVYYLAQALARRGHKVGLATLNHGKAPLVPPGVEVFVLSFPFRLREGQNMYRQGFLENPLFYVVYGFWLWRIAARFGPEVIHAQSKNALAAGTVVSKISGIPLVYTLRDIGISCPWGMCFINGSDVNRCSFGTCLGSCSAYLVNHYSPRRLWDSVKIRLLALFLWPDSRMKQWAMAHASARIAPSLGLLEAMTERVRGSLKSWTIIPHLPPRMEHQETLESVAQTLVPGRYVLYLGKISLGKGIRVFEEAIRTLAPLHKDVTFVFAGKGAWMPPEDLPIRALGSVSHAQALALMKSCACVVVPSLVPEAFNRVVLEAMTLGRPVVTSDAGALRDQIKDRVTGRVVARGSSEQLAQAIGEILSQPEIADRYGSEAQRWVRTELSEDALISATESVYWRVVTSIESPRIALLNIPWQWMLRMVVFANDKAKRLAMHLVRWTGKSSQKIHPKNLLENNDAFAWYRKYLGARDRTLDIGCGHGTHTFVAAQSAQHVVGVDYDPKNLAVCRARAVERGISNVQFESGNAEDRLPFSQEAFDTVLLLDVLEHLYKRDAVLQEVRRVLRPGGQLLVAIPNRETHWKRTLKQAGLFFYSDRDHKIEYSLAEARQELERNGFIIQDPIETVVIDTPWVGFIDLVGGISLPLYQRLMQWKVRKAQEMPEDSIGFQIVAHRT